MKLLILTMLVTQISFATSTKREEFDPRDEDQCFAQMKNLGCGNDQEVSSKCVEAKKLRLSSKCRFIHDKRKASH